MKPADAIVDTKPLGQRGALLVPLLLLALIVVFFEEMFFGGKAPAMRDMIFDFLPQHEFAGEVFRSGHIPLWSTYSGWGKPFAADPQAAAFYPLHAFFYFLPAALAVKLYCTTHLWIAGIGMFALAGHWRMGITAALLVAVSLVFSSWMISCLEFANNLAAIVWMPWILLVVSKIVEGLTSERSIPWSGLTRLVAVLSLLLAVQYLAAYPEFVAYTCVFALAYAVALCAYGRDWRALGWFLLAFALAGFLALMLTAPQFLLSWEFLHYSERAEKIDPGLQMASVHPLNLLGMILPNLNGQPGYPDKYWGGTLFEFMIGTSYVGMLPLVLAPFSVLWLSRAGSQPRARPMRFLCLFLFAAGLVALLLAFGRYTPLYEFLYRSLPGFDRFRYPARFLFFFLFSLVMLTGLGCQAILDSRAEGHPARRWLRPLRISGVILLGALGLGFIVACKVPSFFTWLTQGRFPDAPGPYAAQLSDYRVCLIFALISLVVTFCLSIPAGKWAGVAAIATACANLFVVNRGIQPMLDPGVLEAWQEDLLRSVSQFDGYRVHSEYSGKQQWLYGTHDEDLLTWAISAGVGDSWLKYHMHQTWQGGQKLLRYAALYDLLDGLPRQLAERLADVAGIRYVVGGDPYEQVYWGNASRDLLFTERPSPRPRAFLVDDWIQMSDPKLILKKLLQIDPAAQAIIESTIGGSPTNVPASAPGAAGPGNAGTVDGLKDEANQMSLNVVANSRSLLVINDAWYPGWKAEVDGQSRPVFRVNYLFRGIFLEPGARRVVLWYDPWRYRCGVWVSLLTGLALVFMMILPMISRSREQAAPAPFDRAES